MRVSYSRSALAVLFAALSLFASADAKVKKAKTELQAAYPDPRVHPAMCGRKGLSKSHVCDPHSVLSRASADRVDMVARSVSSYGPLAGVVVFERILLEQPSAKIRFKCKDSVRKAAREILEPWKAEDLVLVSKNDFQFCVIQKSHLLSENDVLEIEESAAELLSAQEHTTVDLLDQAIQFALLQLQQKSAEDATSSGTPKGKLDSALVPKPTGKEMWQMVLAHTIPFIGFGITDNGLMIMFGEAIEQLLGQAIGLSTMGAAATGNLLSDIAGIFLGGQVQALSYKLGAAEPDFTKEQRQLPVTRYCLAPSPYARGVLASETRPRREDDDDDADWR